MTTSSEALANQGKAAFANKKYIQAAELFEQAAQAYDHEGDALLAAEMQNNRSVALIQGGKPEEALDAVAGTDKVFAEAKDIKKQAMAFGNQGAALEELKQYEAALLETGVAPPSPAVGSDDPTPGATSETSSEHAIGTAAAREQPTTSTERSLVTAMPVRTLRMPQNPTGASYGHDNLAYPITSGCREAHPRAATAASFDAASRKCGTQEL